MTSTRKRIEYFVARPDLSWPTLKKLYALHVLKQCEWRVMEAARQLEVSHQTLYNWLEKWGVQITTVAKIDPELKEEYFRSVTTLTEDSTRVTSTNPGQRL